jgi:hypothetical protein
MNPKATMKNNYNKQINYIINNFNFQRVKRVMDFLEWQWFEEGIPELETIIKFARELLNQCVTYNHKQLSSGGFLVTKYEDRLDLKFVVEEFDSEDCCS